MPGSPLNFHHTLLARRSARAKPHRRQSWRYATFSWIIIWSIGEAAWSVHSRSVPAAVDGRKSRGEVDIRNRQQRSSSDMNNRKMMRKMEEKKEQKDTTKKSFETACRTSIN